MIVQYNDAAFPTSQYMFANPTHIKMYVELFGLAPCHTLIRETI